MKNICHTFCNATVVGAALFLSVSGYAKVITTPRDVEIIGSEHYPQPTEYDRPGDRNTQLSLTFKGVRAEGYTKGLITATIAEIEDDDWIDSLSKSDRTILGATMIHVTVTCVGSGKNARLKPGQSLDCNKGDGLHIDLYQPKAPGKWGVFTLIETTDVDDEVKVEEKVATKTNLTSSVIQPIKFPELKETKMSTGKKAAVSTTGKESCIIM